MKSGFVLTPVFPGEPTGRVGGQRRPGTRPGQRLLIPPQPTGAVVCELPQRRTMSAEISVCLAAVTSTHLSSRSQPICWCFFLFQEEMGISCELLESDFLKCSVGFPFMRSKSKVRGRVGDFPGSPQPFPPASDSNSGLALRFPPAPDGPWSRGLSLSSKRRAPSVRDALWPYCFGKQHLVGRLRVLFSGTFHEPWSP